MRFETNLYTRFRGNERRMWEITVGRKKYKKIDKKKKR